MGWRLLLDDEMSPKLNLAREEAILIGRQQGLCKDTLRLWRNRKSVIIGSLSDPRSEVDLDLCETSRIPVIRRTSGGGAVYHDLGNLNLSVVFDSSTFPIPNDILKMYQVFSRAMVAGLSEVRVTAEFRPPNSIISNSKKISGFAIHKMRSASLIHGTLLVNTDLETLSDSPKCEGRGGEPF